MANNFKEFSSGVNFGFHTADPSGAKNGDVYYNSVSNRFRGYQNGSWQDLINNGGSSAFANFASSAITTGSSPVGGSFSTFSNSPAFTFTPSLSGTYKVYTSATMTGNSAGDPFGVIRIFNTSGGATLLQESQGAFNPYLVPSGRSGTAYCQSTYTLVAGTSYVFDIQGANIGNGSIVLDGTNVPFYMFAEGVGLAGITSNVQISNTTGSGTAFSTSPSPIVDLSSNPLEVTVQTNGGDVLVGLQDDGSGNSGYLLVINTPNTNSWPTVRIFFYRDGTLISTQHGMSGANTTFNTSNWPPSAFHFIDANPPAGSHTYTVEAQIFDQDGGTPSGDAFYTTLFAKNLSAAGGGGGASFTLETPYSPATAVNTILPPLGHPLYFASADQSSLSANSDALYLGSGSITNASATGNSADSVIQTGGVAGSGNSGNINLNPGAVNTGVQGNIGLFNRNFIISALFPSNTYGSQPSIVLDSNLVPNSILLVGTSDTSVAATLTSALVFTTGDQTAGAATALSTGGVTIATGNATGAGSGTSSGSMQLNTGNVTDAASTGGTGELLIQTGNASGSGSVGNLQIIAGVSASGANGLVILASGNASSGVNSGQVSIYSGPNSAGPSGPVSISTGNGTTSTGQLSLFTGASSGSGATGIISLQSGNNTGSGNSGAVELISGNATATSGGISLTIGTGATRGRIQFIDGSEGSPYYNWASTDASGNGHWTGLTTYPAASIQTLTAGFTISFAMTNTYLPVTAASAVVSDPTTIIGAGNVAGQSVIIENQGSNTITLKAGGNVKLPQGIDFPLNQYGIISLIWNGTVWNTLSTSANG